MDTKALKDMVDYIQVVKPMFIEGNLRLISDNGKIKIKYDLPLINVRIQRDIDNMVDLVEFVFDTYYLYEWDKTTPLSWDNISYLLHLSPTWFNKLKQRILDKIRPYSKRILKR